MKQDEEYLNEKRERSQQIADKYRRNAARRAGKPVAPTRSSSSAASRRSTSTRSGSAPRRSSSRPVARSGRRSAQALTLADFLQDPRVRIAAAVIAALLALFLLSRIIAGPGRTKPTEPETTTEEETSTEETTEEETEPPLGSYYDNNQPAVALTFDDGPEVNSTNQILDVLEQYNAHATFFYVGQNVEVNPGAVKRAAELGCELGNHTWSHTKMTTMSSEQLAEDFKKTNEAIENASGGVPVTVLRPPYGSSDKEIRDQIDIPVIIWSLDTLDWKTRDTQSTIDTIRDEVKGGDIILMHDIHQPTADAVKEVVPMLIEQGYKLLTVTELYEYYKEPLTLHVGHSSAEIQENPTDPAESGAATNEGSVPATDAAADGNSGEADAANSAEEAGEAAGEGEAATSSSAQQE